VKMGQIPAAAVYRHSIVFPAAKLQPEKTPGEVAGTSSQRWSIATVLQLKPTEPEFFERFVRVPINRDLNSPLTA
jgi:hypothetical protein